MHGAHRGSIKVTDFGTSKDEDASYGDDRQDAFVGTAEYVSPEVRRMQFFFTIIRMLRHCHDLREPQVKVFVPFFHSFVLWNSMNI